MVQEVEISSFDLRYEDLRMRYAGAEKTLLASISDHGIRDPLLGVDTDEGRILLDGFKRYRCAQKLMISIVPYSSLGGDEAIGIITLIRLSNSRNLTILEQAKLIDELRSVYKMTASQIADRLEKSRAWVSVRLGIIGEMSPCIKEKIFKGAFPVYSYMYTIRKFMRINRIKKGDIEEFVCLVAGLKLSTRDIDLLAHGYFNGSEEFQEQIRDGNIPWALSQLKESVKSLPDCNEQEQRMLRDLEITHKYMVRVTHKSRDNRFKSSSFFAHASLLVQGILSQIDLFSKAMKEFYDRAGQA